MDLGLRGKVAAVAAASKGLGRACADALAREGAHVAICARDAESLRSAEQDLLAYGVRVHAVAADLNAPGECERFMAAAEQALGPVDVLVANNGGPRPGMTAEMTDDDYRAAFEQNLLATVRLTRQALPSMRRRGWGRIVAITSYAVKQPIDGLALSNTVRTGLIGYLKTLASEVAPDGVTVNAVAPGPFLTDRMRALADQRGADVSIEDIVRTQAATVPAGRVGQPEELGALVAFLASEQAGFITGTTIQIDGGLVRSTL